MFGFLKDKLKTALHKFSKDIEKDAEITAVKKEKISESITEENFAEMQNSLRQVIQAEESLDKNYNKLNFIKSEKQDIIEREINNAKTDQEKAENNAEKQHRKLQSQQDNQKTDKFEEIESKKKKNPKSSAEDFEKHTEYITVDLANKQNQGNTVIEIEDEDFKEEFAEKKGFFSKLKEKFTKKKEDQQPKEEIIHSAEKKVQAVEVEKIIEDVKQEISIQDSKVPFQEFKPFKAEEKEKKTEEKKQEPIEKKFAAEQEQSKGFLSKLTDTITKTNLTEEKFNDIFWELEIILMENNVAVEVIDKMRDDLKKELVDTKVKRGTVEEIIAETLKRTVNDLFDVENIDFLARVKTKKPFVIAFFGINGSGKTTTIAKIAYLLKQHNFSCVIAAGDTFRAAAIQQMEEHTQKLNIRLIKQDYGADPAAVAFDAIKYAEAKAIDVVLVDTAGRMHSNTNLMDEMKKIIRVAKPDMKVFIGEAITGNDCVEQAKEFNTIVGIDAIILCKADVDDKGGAALSISYVTKKPILFLGVGQNYQDLQKFDKKVIIEGLGV